MSLKGQVLSIFHIGQEEQREGLQVTEYIAMVTKTTANLLRGRT